MRGSSLLMTRKRVGRVPVQGSRYFTSTVSMSSPEMDSSRSTTWLTLVPPSRASLMIARGFPMSGERPKLVARLARVGPQ
jgi:hypothetical protein